MSLLIKEYPLVFLPSLAVKVGLNEAIILQQIGYWLENPNAGVAIDGYKWVYNSVDQWNEQFPFWSANTIRRAINNLRKDGYLIAKKLSDDLRNNTLYYRIDNDKLNDDLGIPKMGKPLSQSWQISNRTETTTNILPNSSFTDQCKEVVDYLNLKAGTSFRLAESHKRTITARLNEGATVDEMKRVIDAKCSEWLNDQKMKRYLQPSTLFRASKYDNYVGALSNDFQIGTDADSDDYMRGI